MVDIPLQFYHSTTLHVYFLLGLLIDFEERCSIFPQHIGLLLQDYTELYLRRIVATTVRTSNTTTTAVQLKKFRRYCGTQWSEESANGTNPKPDKSRPSSNPIFFRSILVLSNLCLGFTSVFFSSDFPTETVYVTGNTILPLHVTSMSLKNSDPNV
jgi:hypothetical protein